MAPSLNQFKPDNSSGSHWAGYLRCSTILRLFQAEVACEDRSRRNGSAAAPNYRVTADLAELGRRAGA